MIVFKRCCRYKKKREKKENLLKGEKNAISFVINPSVNLK